MSTSRPSSACRDSLATALPSSKVSTSYFTSRYLSKNGDHSETSIPFTIPSSPPAALRCLNCHYQIVSLLELLLRSIIDQQQNICDTSTYSSHIIAHGHLSGISIFIFALRFCYNENIMTRMKAETKSQVSHNIGHTWVFIHIYSNRVFTTWLSSNQGLQDEETTMMLCHMNVEACTWQLQPVQHLSPHPLQSLLHSLARQWVIYLLWEGLLVANWVSQKYFLEPLLVSSPLARSPQTPANYNVFQRWIFKCWPQRWESELEEIWMCCSL